MAKMKKALGSLALIIALAMIIGMLPTVVLADGANTVGITTDAEDAKAGYDEEGVVTVEGTISSNEADVTILAVRTASEIGEEEAESYLAGLGDQLEDAIVYIDQVGAEDDNYVIDGDGANWNFTFIPKNAPGGSYITVFVGGTNVGVVDFVSFEACIPAPTLAAQTWYMGEDLVMNITYTDAEAIAAWEEAIESVLVNGDAFVDYVIDEDEATITFTGLSEAVTSIKITATEYADVEIPGISPEFKTAGTIVPVEASVVENDEATVQFTLTDSTTPGAGWLEAITPAAVTCSVKDEDAFSQAAYNLDGTSLTVTVPTVGEADSVTYTVKIAVDNYTEATADVTVVSPTKADVDALPAYLRVVYGENGNTEDDAEGAATITLPCADGTTATNGSTITWTTTPTLGEGVVSIDGDVLTVVRPIEGATDPQQVTVTAEVTKGDYAIKTKNYTLSVNQIGVAGPTFTVENVALTTAEGGVFGKTGKAIVTVTHAEVNPALSKVMVGGVELFYSPERMKFVGIIPEATADDVVADITVVEGQPTNLYYGKITVPNEDGDIGGGDVSRALGILKGTLTEPTDPQLLAADVMGIGSVNGGAVSRILGVLKGTGTKADFGVLRSAE